MPFIYEARRIETVDIVQVATNMTYDAAEPADMPIVVERQEGQVPVIPRSGDRPKHDGSASMPL